MEISFSFFTVFFALTSVSVLCTRCGCKTLTPCYQNMLDLLHEPGETYCIEDAAIGTSTLTIFLHALKEFCSEVVTVETTSTTFDNRNLYEVIVHDNKNDAPKRRDLDDKPTIVIDAGQEGGVKAVQFALFVLEQLVACQENRPMVQNVKWVIMPSTNPDGLEFSRYRNSDWHKNLKVDADEVSFGVDISRNFDEKWDACPIVQSGFSSNYPGLLPASEKETIFIKQVISKHKKDAKIYLTIRRDGHHIAYPYAATPNNATKLDQLAMIAEEVASKVNMRSGGVHIFRNSSIYKLEGKERCGHSVDWVFANGIFWAFEMRIFLEKDNSITSMFQSMPRGYENTLQNGYFAGIKEFYSVLTNKKKYGKLN